MKKTLLIICTLTSMLPTLVAQVTRISDNTDLVAAYPITPSRVIFTNYADHTLWVSNATEAGTTQIPTAVLYDDAGSVAVMNGKLFFSGKTAANGSELWVSDGTAAGTKLVKDINPGTADSRPTAMISYNNLLYFYANHPNYGPELWISDGTEAGTKMLKDIQPGTAGSYDATEEFVVFKNEIYFTANSSGTELWKTDGTEAGTVLVKDINPGTPSSQPRFLEQLPGKLFFSANDGTTGRELWVTDGTTMGTTLVKDIFPGPTGSNVTHGVNLNDKLVFSARSSGGNDELWASDGSSAGTMMLKDIFQGPLASSPDLTGGVFFNEKLIFAATSHLYGRELFVTDGTVAGTQLFRDIQAGAQGSNPVIWQDRNILTAKGDPKKNLWNGKIFVQTSLGTPPLVSNALWITDGTPGNITFLKDFGIMGLINSWFYTQSGVYFAAKDPSKSYEIYKSAGTTATTTLFADLNVGAEASYPIFLPFILNGKIFVSADDGNSGGVNRDLFVIDGPELPLPLRLLHFAGVTVPEGVRLDWSTANENGVKEFDIERSIDGIRFNAIGQVKAAGNSPERRFYSYPDREAYQKNSRVLYYRLKIKDENSRFAYSPVVLIPLGHPLSQDLRAAPNPAKDFVRVNYDSDVESEGQLRIINNNGQIVKSILVRLFKGNNQQVISLDGLAPGIYHAEIIIKGMAAQNTRFIKQ